MPRYEVNVDASIYASIEADNEEEAKQKVIEDSNYGEELLASATCYAELEDDTNYTEGEKDE